MAKHLIVMSVVMEEMDGSPEDSAAILLGDHLPESERWTVFEDYLDACLVEITAEEYGEDDE